VTFPSNARIKCHDQMPWSDVLTVRMQRGVLNINGSPPADYHCHPWLYSFVAGCTITRCLQADDKGISIEIPSECEAAISHLVVRLTSWERAAGRTCVPLFAAWSSWRIQSSPRSRCHTPGCRRWHCGHLCSANPATPSRQRGREEQKCTHTHVPWEPETLVVQVKVRAARWSRLKYVVNNHRTDCYDHLYRYSWCPGEDCSSSDVLCSTG